MNLGQTKVHLLMAKSQLSHARFFAPTGKLFYTIVEAQIAVDNALLQLERLIAKDKLLLMKIKDVTGVEVTVDECQEDSIVETSGEDNSNG